MNKILRVLNSRLANIILPLGDFLFIYQLEEYNNRFFLSWVRPRFYKRGLQKVGRLQWTLKARTLYFLSLGLLLGCCLAVAVIEPYFNKLLAFFLIFFVFTFFTPLFLVLSSFLVYPLENRMKSKQIKAARSKLISMKELVIIAVAGSVGKTSTRHYLSEILKSKYKTFTPKGNYNTLLGISEEVLNMPTDTQALVVELGEFFPGDLMELAGLVKPKILVLTKTADQHIEKFGNAEAIDHEFVSLTSFPTLSAVYLSAENRIAPQLKGKGKVQTVNTKTWSQYFAKIKSFSLPRAESVSGFGCGTRRC
ncbi:hypothetical protein HY024_01810 [Candidatus Curtissbacteria bacterium]|nr:hypothetical protein [Candidatus Curtissbacteria bacterium]